MSVYHYVPTGFECASFFNNLFQPSTEKYINNITFQYFERALFQRCCNVLDFKLPDMWGGSTRDFFLYVMFREGYATIFNTIKYGLVFQPCSLSGYGLYYAPIECIVSNPLLPELNVLKIGVDCEILKLTPDYMGVWDVISFYAEKLSLLSASFDMSAINSRVAFVMGAKTKAAQKSLKLIMDKISNGQSTVIYDSVLTDDIQRDNEVFDYFDRNNVKNGYLGQEFLEDIQTLIFQFDSEIGIPSPPAEKKERMIRDEVNIKTIDSTCRASQWEECFNSSAKLVNKMFSTDISCKYKFGRGE